MTISELRHYMATLLFVHPANRAAVGPNGNGVIQLSHAPMLFPGPRVRVRLEPNGAGAGFLSIHDASLAGEHLGFAYFTATGSPATITVARMATEEYAAHGAWGPEGPDWGCDAYDYRYRKGAPRLLYTLNSRTVLILASDPADLAGLRDADWTRYSGRPGAPAL